MLLTSVLAANALVGAAPAWAQPIINTVAGDARNGSRGFSGDGGTATVAQLAEPYGAAVDSAGNIYIADTVNQRIRKVTAATGIISTIAGTGTAGFGGDNGPAISAQFNSPVAIAVDSAGNLYISDQNNHRVRKVTAAGIITTVAGSAVQGFAGDGGAATSARLNYPYGVALDASGNLYIADTGNSRIRKVTAATGRITTFAGIGYINPDGTSGFSGEGVAATSARLNHPNGVEVDGAGNVYIADTQNNRVRKVDTSGIITTVAGIGPANGHGAWNGDGIPATSAQLDFPYSVAIDTQGNLLIADYFHYRIRKVSGGVISTVAGIGLSGLDGDGGPATSSYISDPVGVIAGANSSFYIVDQASNRIRRVSAPPPAAPPVVTVNPLSQHVLAGSRVLFSAGASGSPTPAVQWQVSADNGQTFTNIAGATTATYAATATAADNGKQFRAVFSNVGGSAATAAAVLVVRLPGLRTVDNDVDGDGIADLIVWRPGSATWYWLTSSSHYTLAGAKAWGAQSEGDVPLMGDIDGDGVGDLVVWRASTGTWFWLTSSSGFNYAAQGAKQWGSQSLGDVPMLGDIDGDARADLIVWRASSGTWYWLTSSSGYTGAGAKQWGSQAFGDVPKLADVDGDRKADLIVWRASSGTWYWLTSSTGYNYTSQGAKQWGSQGHGDIPLVGDLDGDGKTELIVWRGPTGVWYWLTSATAYASQVQGRWGSQAAGDSPMISDFDGDGRGDLTVWRAPTGTWYWLTSSSGFAAPFAVAWGSGAMNDVPMAR